MPVKGRLEKMKMFRIYDIKADAYELPKFAPTTGVALRGIEAEMSQEGHRYARWPKDFILYEVGETCEQSGKVSGMDNLREIGPLNDLFGKEEKNDD